VGGRARQARRGMTDMDNLNTKQEVKVMKPQERIKQELELIIRKNPSRILQACDVVEFAKNPDTELHKHFTWEDSEAAREYRLWQARTIIHTCVHIIPNYSEPIDVYVSLKTDRTMGGGGYRSLVSVMSNRTLRLQLLQEALEEMKVFQGKYKTLRELVPIFDGIKAVQSRVSTRKQRAGVRASM
jgi:hypothetical protein